METSTTSVMHHIRQKEFSRLDESNHVYLDHTGAALYPSSLVHSHYRTLSSNILGNPHSTNPSSTLSTTLVEHTRHRILTFFNADPIQYSVIFTHNASHALKLVGEAFPFRKGSVYALLADNHNSVHGIRQYARAARATVRYIPLTHELRAEHPEKHLGSSRRQNRPRYPSLFAFPAQSNFSGVQHPLSLVQTARRLGWYVLLDAAAYAPTSPLDLSMVPAHFVAVSFYKLFGFPTGVGALIVRRSGCEILRRPWFAGGTVKFVTTATGHSMTGGGGKGRGGDGWIHALQDGAEAFEDGTLNFTAIPTVAAGLDFLSSIGMERIHHHVNALTTHLLSTLYKARWRDGRRKVVVYGPADGGEGSMRGGTVAFDVIGEEDGERVDGRLVERAASKAGISLRVGCFCNPGAAEKALGIGDERVGACLRKMDAEDFSLDGVSRCVGEGFLGCVRVSVGVSSNAGDIARFGTFIEGFRGDGSAEEGVGGVGGCSSKGMESEIESDVSAAEASELASPRVGKRKERRMGCHPWLKV